MFVKLRDKFLGITKVDYLFRQRLNELDQINLFRYRELKALEILRPYLPDCFLVETSYSLSFQEIQHILNDVKMFSPKVILEFGSGLSTLIIDKFITLEKLETKIYSVDQDGSWQSNLKESCNNVIFFNFTLSKNSIYSFNKDCIWFDIFEDSEINLIRPDLVIVDAPKGSDSFMSRFGFIPFILNKFSNNLILYIDDTDRSDESKIAFLAQKQLGLKFIHRNIKYIRMSNFQFLISAPS